MTRAVRRAAVAMLRRLRRYVATHGRGLLLNVAPGGTAGFTEARRALEAAGFYARLRRPAILRAVDRAIAALRAGK